MIIVTGGAGFIGSALIWQLNQSSATDIVVVDDLGTGQKWQNLVKRQVSDIIAIKDFSGYLKGHHHKVDAIFHMGACSSTVEIDSDFLVENNIHASMRLFAYCCEKKIPFIYASSAATYGKEEEDFAEDEARLERLRPINKYGFSKHFFDQWVVQQKVKPPRWAGLKFFNVYGPNESHKGGQASVAFHAYPQILKHNSLKLFKSYRESVAHGQQKRDFVYVKDVVAVAEHFYAAGDREISGIYNVGTGKARSFLDLFHAVREASHHRDAQVEFIDMPERIRDHYQYFTQADLTLLRNRAGWQRPFTSLDEGVKDYVQNYLATDDPYL